MQVARRIVPLALGMAIACSASALVGPEGLQVAIMDGDGRALTTDSAAYRARRVQQLWPGVFVYGFTVIARYTNPTDAPVYLWTCGPDSRPPLYSVVAEGQRTSTGVAYNAAWACVGHDRPIRVEPGQTRVDTIAVRGPNAFDGITHRPIDPILEGRFQLMYAVQSCRTEGDCPLRDEALTRSNAFAVRIAP